MRDADDVSLDRLDTDAVRETVETAAVACAVLYGSHARGEASPTSDVDIAVEFEPSLSPSERTRARLELIERLTRALGTDAVDVVPLSKASESLRREIYADGIVLHGTLDEAFQPEESDRTRRERLEEFDDLLANIEQVV